MNMYVTGTNLVFANYAARAWNLGFFKMYI